MLDSYERETIRTLVKDLLYLGYDYFDILQQFEDILTEESDKLEENEQ